MKPETEDRREEDALASIFGKKNYTDESPFFSNELDKTTVIEKIPQTAKPHGFKIEAVRELEDEDDYNSEQEITEEENEEDDKPFRVENTVFDKTRKKRKKDYIREQ
ncbi:MAG: hypothetical protein FWG44_08500, partial [Oscillospiraceae bacterium]|nr:hypothetical protein [Oscillospiraceae bacterium]